MLQSELSKQSSRKSEVTSETSKSSIDPIENIKERLGAKYVRSKILNDTAIKMFEDLIDAFDINIAKEQGITQECLALVLKAIIQEKSKGHKKLSDGFYALIDKLSAKYNSTSMTPTFFAQLALAADFYIGAFHYYDFTKISALILNTYIKNASALGLSIDEEQAIANIKSELANYSKELLQALQGEVFTGIDSASLEQELAQKDATMNSAWRSKMNYKNNQESESMDFVETTSFMDTFEDYVNILKSLDPESEEYEFHLNSLIEHLTEANATKILWSNYFASHTQSVFHLLESLPNETFKALLFTKLIFLACLQPTVKNYTTGEESAAVVAYIAFDGYRPKILLEAITLAVLKREDEAIVKNASSILHDAFGDNNIIPAILKIKDLLEQQNTIEDDNSSVDKDGYSKSVADLLQHFDRAHDSILEVMRDKSFDIAAALQFLSDQVTSAKGENAGKKVTNCQEILTKFFLDIKLFTSSTAKLLYQKYQINCRDLLSYQIIEPNNFAKLLAECNAKDVQLIFSRKSDIDIKKWVGLPKEWFQFFAKFTRNKIEQGKDFDANIVLDFLANRHVQKCLESGIALDEILSLTKSKTTANILIYLEYYHLLIISEKANRRLDEFIAHCDASIAAIPASAAIQLWERIYLAQNMPRQIGLLTGSQANKLYEKGYNFNDVLNFYNLFPKFVNARPYDFADIIEQASINLRSDLDRKTRILLTSDMALRCYGIGLSPIFVEKNYIEGHPRTKTTIHVFTENYRVGLNDLIKGLFTLAPTDADKVRLMEYLNTIDPDKLKTINIAPLFTPTMSSAITAKKIDLVEALSSLLNNDKARYSKCEQAASLFCTANTTIPILTSLPPALTTHIAPTSYAQARTSLNSSHGAHVQREAEREQTASLPGFVAPSTPPSKKILFRNGCSTPQHKRYRDEEDQRSPDGRNW